MPSRVLQSWRNRFTIRTRLTVAFSVLFGLAGSIFVLIVTTFMRVVPDYVSVRATDVPDASDAQFAAPIQGDVVEGSLPVAGFTLNSAQSILNTSLVVSIVVLIILIAVGAAVSWIIAGKMLRPLQAINRAAQLASTGSLDHRVGLRGPKDELQDLSDTFDMMLARLDEAFQSHKRFAANASHELRTPLASTETMLEVALSDPDITVDELRMISGRVLETNRRNAQTVEALLSLAQIGAQPVAREPVDLKRLVGEVVATVSEEAQAMKVDLIPVLREGTILADETLLRPALINLVTNAVRHNDEGGLVEITLGQVGGATALRVENTGQVLSPERIAQLREPFARGAGRVAFSATRPRGSGLGLAIATTAIEAQGGTLILMPRTGGGLVALISMGQENSDA